MGAGHSHGTEIGGTPEASRSKERAIGIAALLTGGFMGAEVVGGVVSGSLALLANAGHMLTDFASLVLAWFAFRLARRPADWKRTYGFDRFRARSVCEWAQSLRHRDLDMCGSMAPVQRTYQYPGRPHAMGGACGPFREHRVVLDSFRTQGDKTSTSAPQHYMSWETFFGSVAALAASLIIIFTGWMPDQSHPIRPCCRPHSPLRMECGKGKRAHLARRRSRRVRCT